MKVTFDGIVGKLDAAGALLGPSRTLRHEVRLTTTAENDAQGHALICLEIVGVAGVYVRAEELVGAALALEHGVKER